MDARFHFTSSMLRPTAIPTAASHIPLLLDLQPWTYSLGFCQGLQPLLPCTIVLTVTSSVPSLSLFLPLPCSLLPSFSLPDIREFNHRPGETQAWNHPGWPRALKPGIPWATIKVRLASYLGIRPLGLIMAVRPHPDKVKLKYGSTQTPLSGETQVWNPLDLVSPSMA